MYWYFDRSSLKDPAIGLRPVEWSPSQDRIDPAKPPDYDNTEGGEWWYHGYPCETYITDPEGVLSWNRCSGRISHGGLCAACRNELIDVIRGVQKDSPDIVDNLRELLDQV